jgi:hypothetical protein
MARSLDFPSGRPLITAARLQRWRPIPPGGQVVAPETALTAGGPPTLAGIMGRVAEVHPDRGVLVDGAAALLSGVLGVGGTASGLLWFLPRGESVAMAVLQPGCILVYPQRLPITLMQRAAQAGVAGIVASSASARELEGFARVDMTALLDGQAPLAPNPPLPILFTEGIGDQQMDTVVLRFLTERTGQPAFLSGLCRPRRNLRPELLMAPEPNVVPLSLPQDTGIRPGALVRVILGEHTGAQGQVVQPLAHAVADSLGRPQPTVRMRLDGGALVPVPLAWIERVG